MGYSASDSSTNFSTVSVTGAAGTSGGFVGLKFEYPVLNNPQWVNGVVIIGCEDSATSADGLGY